MAPETTIHGITEVIISKNYTKSAEGREYVVVSIAIIGEDDKQLHHVTAFTQEGDVEITTLPDDSRGSNVRPRGMV